MTLATGDKAPDFLLDGPHGKQFSLATYAGKMLVLYFYPRDDTPGCTKEACAFNDHFNRFKKHGIAVIGISKDSVKSHEKFASKYGLDFDLGSDPECATIQAYGSWVEKSMYGKKYMGISRDTFLIDENGVIRHIWRNVKVEGHAEAVLEQALALRDAADTPSA